MSSRQIEKATYEDVASRYICGGDAHPDHDTICTFRRQNAALFQESFVKVLEYAREMGVLAKRGGVSVDGTKIGANASKHAAVSHGHTVEMIAELEGEVQTLMALAEQADHETRPETLKIPEEIARREKRLAKLKQAKAVIEERHVAHTAEKQQEYEEKTAAREARRSRGESVRGPEPKPPSTTPEAKEQYNFTDPESRIMKAGKPRKKSTSTALCLRKHLQSSPLPYVFHPKQKRRTRFRLAIRLQRAQTAIRSLRQVGLWGRARSSPTGC